MAIVTIREAQARLPEIIRVLSPDEEVLITEDDRPVARLVPIAAPPDGKPRQLGTLHGTVSYVAPDFDAPLEDFREYME